MAGTYPLAEVSLVKQGESSFCRLRLDGSATRINIPATSCIGLTWQQALDSTGTVTGIDGVELSSTLEAPVLTTPEVLDPNTIYAVYTGIDAGNYPVSNIRSGTNPQNPAQDACIIDLGGRLDNTYAGGGTCETTSWNQFASRNSRIGSFLHVDDLDATILTAAPAAPEEPTDPNAAFQSILGSPQTPGDLSHAFLADIPLATAENSGGNCVIATAINPNNPTPSPDQTRTISGSCDTATWRDILSIEGHDGLTSVPSNWVDLTIAVTAGHAPAVEDTADTLSGWSDWSEVSRGDSDDEVEVSVSYKGKNHF